MKWELGRVTRAESTAAPPLPPRLNEEEADKTTNAFQLCLRRVFLGPPLPLNGKLYVLVEQAGVRPAAVPRPEEPRRGPGPDAEAGPRLDPEARQAEQHAAAGLRPPLPGGDPRRRRRDHRLPDQLRGDRRRGHHVPQPAVGARLPQARPERAAAQPGSTRKPASRSCPTSSNATAGGPAGRSSQNGRVVLTAYDSDKLECLDLRTGKVLWSVPREADDLYVGGVVNDRVIVVGQQPGPGLPPDRRGPGARSKPKVAFEPRRRSPRRPGTGSAARASSTSRSARTTPARDARPPAEIWAINVETGQVASKTAARKRQRHRRTRPVRARQPRLPGRHGVRAVRLGARLLPAAGAEEGRDGQAPGGQPEGPARAPGPRRTPARRRQAEGGHRRLQGGREEQPPDPRSSRCCARSSTSRTPNCSATTSPPPSGPRRVRGALRECRWTTERAARGQGPPRGRDRSAASGSTCTCWPAGREAQGRLGEAFDQYLALANLGEGKKLLEMPDEPNVRMRPDVWARGRIEAMIRRAERPGRPASRWRSASTRSGTRSRTATT